MHQKDRTCADASEFVNVSLLFTFFKIAVSEIMPKTPRKNPTPRKLLRLSADELQQGEHAHLKEVEFSFKDSLPSTLDKDSVLDLSVNSSSHSEFGSHAAAPVANVESRAHDKALAGSRRRSTKRTSTVPSKDPDSNVSRKTSAKTAGRGSKQSKSSQKKVSRTETRKVTRKDAKQTLQTDKLPVVDSSVELCCVSASDEYSCKPVVQHCRSVHVTDESVHQQLSVSSSEITDPSATLPADACNEDIDNDNRTAAELPSTDNIMAASATCGASDSTGATGEAVDVCLPTPQKNQLRFLSEELLSLNQESARITTHVHRRSGTTPRRGHNHSGDGRSLSTPRRFSVLNSDSRSNSRSPRSTPRKTNSGHKTPMKVKFSFSTTPSKSQKETTKAPSSKRKSPRSLSILKFPTPSKTQTKRKLYVESPEHGARKPAKMSRYVLVM